MKKIILILILPILSVVSVQAADWESTPSACPTDFDGTSCLPGESRCGDVCYDYNTLRQDVSDNHQKVSHTVNSVSGSGGLQVNCEANDGSEPFCSPGGLRCQPNSACALDNRRTICGDWQTNPVDATKQANCGDCARDGRGRQRNPKFYLNCDLQSDGSFNANPLQPTPNTVGPAICEVESTGLIDGSQSYSDIVNSFDESAQPSGSPLRGIGLDGANFGQNGSDTNTAFVVNTEDNRVSNQLCGPSCKNGYYNNDGDVSNGCEVLNGEVCIIPASGAPGNWNCNGNNENLAGTNTPCTCEAGAPENFVTGENAQYGTNDPLLWGTQFGDGPLLNLSNSDGDTFIVHNNGSIDIVGPTTGGGGFSLGTLGTVNTANPLIWAQQDNSDAYLMNLTGPQGSFLVANDGTVSFKPEDGEPGDDGDPGEPGAPGRGAPPFTSGLYDVLKVSSDADNFPITDVESINISTRLEVFNYTKTSEIVDGYRYPKCPGDTDNVSFDFGATNFVLSSRDLGSACYDHHIDAGNTSSLVFNYSNVLTELSDIQPYRAQFEDQIRPSIRALQFEDEPLMELIGYNLSDRSQPIGNFTVFRDGTVTLGSGNDTWCFGGDCNNTEYQTGFFPGIQNVDETDTPFLWGNQTGSGPLLELCGPEKCLEIENDGRIIVRDANAVSERFYTLDGTTNTIYQWDSTNKYDLSSAEISGNHTVGSAYGTLHNLFVHPAGRSIYVKTQDELIQYDLDTPWNISTVSSSKMLSRSGIAAAPRADGSKMFYIQNGNIAARSLANSWEVDSPGSDSLPTTSLSADDLEFSNGGSKVFTMNSSLGEISSYSLSTAWNENSINKPSVNSLSLTDSVGFDFRNEGRSLIYVTSSGSMKEEIMNSPFDISTVESSSSIINLNTQSGGVTTDTIDVAFAGNFESGSSAVGGGGSATYIGKTDSESNGGFNGYNAFNSACQSVDSSSHACTEQEMLNTINTKPDITSSDAWNGNVWISGGAPGYTAEANDCGGWTSQSGNHYGKMWMMNVTDSDGIVRQEGYGRMTTCDQELKVACCK